MTKPTADERARPVLLYDGECEVCTRLVEAAGNRFTADVDYLPFQTAPLTTYGVSAAEAHHSLHWVSVEGRIGHGSTAVARLLVASGGAWALAGRVLLAPPFSFAAAAVYWLVARNRSHLPLPARRS